MRTRDVFLELLSPAVIRATRDRRPRPPVENSRPMPTPKSITYAITAASR